MGEVCGVGRIASGVSRYSRTNTLWSGMFSDSELDLCRDVEA